MKLSIIMIKQFWWDMYDRFTTPPLPPDVIICYIILGSAVFIYLYFLCKKTTHAIIPVIQNVGRLIHLNQASQKNLQNTEEPTVHFLPEDNTKENPNNATSEKEKLFLLQPLE